MHILNEGVLLSVLTLGSTASDAAVGVASGTSGVSVAGAAEDSGRAAGVVSALVGSGAAALSDVAAAASDVAAPSVGVAAAAGKAGTC